MAGNVAALTAPEGLVLRIACPEKTAMYYSLRVSACICMERRRGVRGSRKTLLPSPLPLGEVQASGLVLLALAMLAAPVGLKQHRNSFREESDPLIARTVSRGPLTSTKLSDCPGGALHALDSDPSIPPVKRDNLNRYHLYFGGLRHRGIPEPVDERPHQLIEVVELAPPRVVDDVDAAP